MSAAPVVRRADEVPPSALGRGVAVRELLNDDHGCRGLHQRRLRLGGGAQVAGTAGGLGEAWYVITGSAFLKTERTGCVALVPGTAVWLDPDLGYACQAQRELRILAVTVRAGFAVAGPARCVVRLADCAPEITGDREFRVLLSEGLTITQFAGLIPPGRAPAHHHAYDEVVHVLDGEGVVHLGEPGSETETAIGPGTSIYLPPQVPHCLENTGSVPLQVLGVFHPAGSPAAKQVS
jgi:mannose-6-phosphate isomerase-like protein (cupin superfamily)